MIKKLAFYIYIKKLKFIATKIGCVHNGRSMRQKKQSLFEENKSDNYYVLKIKNDYTKLYSV